jgi:predicted phosphodiesterase
MSITPAGEDILVLAGDICVHTEHMELTRQMAKFLDVPIVLLSGNHEFYSHRPDTHTWESTLIDLRAAAHHTDKIVKGEVTFLEDSSAVYEGVRFIGATLWTDMKLFGDDPTIQYVVEHSLNDYRFIRKDDRKKISAYDTIDRHMASRQYITNRLAEKFDGPTVVVTHHTPSWLSVHPDYKGSKITAGYSSRLETLMLSYEPVLWIHGHTHYSFDYEIGKTRVVCNPRGYFQHSLNPDFNPDLIIEIGENHDS